MKFRHECPDLDYQLIDASDDEFALCRCDLGPEAQEIRDAIEGELGGMG